MDKPTNPTKKALLKAPTSPTNLLVDFAHRLSAEYLDVIDPMWISRHMKLIHKIGWERYHNLATQARGGKVLNSRAYMAKLVNKELKRFG